MRTGLFENQRRVVGKATVGFAALLLVACGDDSMGGEFDPGGSNAAENQGENWGPPPGSNQTNNADPGPPEEVQEYDFSSPAIVGHHVYIANETLNSVAVIDSRTLGIETIMTGARPTIVVGPGEEGPAGENARVMALNEGSYTVTMIDPYEQTAQNVPVLARSNSIAMSPGGEYGIVWFDSSAAEPGQMAGDLSAVSVVSAQGSYQVAVGFHVRDVRFDASGEQALVVTDDGISVLKLDAVTGDSFSPPRNLVPPSRSEHRIRDLNLLVTSDGRYVVAYREGHAFLIVADLQEVDAFSIDLPAAPTGVVLRETDDEVELLAVLRSEGRLLRATVPDGLMAAYEGPGMEILLSGEGDNGAGDNGNGDGGAGDDGNGDNGAGDNGAGDNGAGDSGNGDGGAGDGGAGDNGNGDGGAGDGGEGDPDPDPDPEPEPEPDWTEYEGFGYLELPFVGPGAIALSRAGDAAVLFTTVLDEKRAVLLDFDSEEMEILAFEKRINGVLADGRGDTFIVFHDKEPGSTAGLSPNDPEFVARSHGFTILDVRTGTTRLILTELEPGEAALWSPAAGDAKVFLTFASPEPGEAVTAAHRDVVQINLRSFRKDTFRLSSLPDGMGLIPAAEKVYVNQIHPQGRMTFVDLVEQRLQTVTGYQLNAGIQ